jgi:hypothetical protein
MFRQDVTATVFRRATQTLGFPGEAPEQTRRQEKIRQKWLSLGPVFKGLLRLATLLNPRGQPSINEWGTGPFRLDLNHTSKSGPIQIYVHGFWPSRVVENFAAVDNPRDRPPSSGECWSALRMDGLITELYAVVGQHGDDSNYEFGEYRHFTDAVEVWRGHHLRDGPARIEQRTEDGETVRIWLNGWQKTVSA